VAQPLSRRLRLRRAGILQSKVRSGTWACPWRITSKRWSADASSGALPGRRRASQAGPAVSYDGNIQRELNKHTRTPHSDTIIIKCNGPCIGTSMHMPTRGWPCLGLLGGHPPLPGHRHPPPGRWGSPPPHKPAYGRRRGSPARPDRRAPPQQREVHVPKKMPASLSPPSPPSLPPLPPPPPRSISSNLNLRRKK